MSSKGVAFTTVVGAALGAHPRVGAQESKRTGAGALPCQVLLPGSPALLLADSPAQKQDTWYSMFSTWFGWDS